MRASRQLVFSTALLAAAAFEPISHARADVRTLGSQGDAKITVPAAYNCENPAPITVHGPNEDLFVGDRVALQKLLGLIRVALGFECPNVARFEITGVVGDRVVFEGSAAKSDNWRLLAKVTPLDHAKERLQQAGDGLPGLQHITNVLENQSGILSAADFAQLTRSAEQLASRIAGNGFERFRARLEGLPVNFDGAAEAESLYDAFDPHLAALAPTYQSRYRQAAVRRAEMIIATVRSRAEERIATFNGNWRAAVTLVRETQETADSFRRNERSTVAEQLVRTARSTAQAGVDAGLARFQAKLETFPKTWRALAQIDGIQADLQSASGAGLQLTRYRASAKTARGELIAALERNAVAELDATGTLHTDVGEVVETGEALAAQFEDAGAQRAADRVLAATGERIAALLESSLPLYRKRLSEAPATRDRLAALDEERAVFEERAEAFPAYAGYVAATEERMVSMRQQICQAPLDRAGIDLATADRQVLTGEGPVSLRAFLCRLDANGHQVTGFDLNAEGDGGTLKIAEADGPFTHVRMHAVEARPDQVMFVAYAIGDANRQDDLSVSDWEGYAADLMREMPSGAPDDNGITECDRLAADPDDPSALADGVAFAAMDVEAALDACIAAHEFAPDNTRIRFQLARVIYQAGDSELARQYLEPAADADYAAANGLLGDMLFATAESDAQEEAALERYRKAAESGYEPAQEIVEAFEPVEVEAVALPEPEEPTEDEMIRAYGRSTQGRGCDIVKGCSIMGGVVTAKLTDFKKIQCSSLGAGQSLCTYRGHLLCRSGFGGVYDSLMRASCGNFGPTQSTFVKEDNGWSMIQQ
jgi:hypothetical protein